MKQYGAKKIKNIVIAGHSGAGKTSLAEAMLFLAGATDRLGKTADGNTVCDFDPEEIKRKASVSTAVAPIEWSGCKINLIDVPGQFDYAGGTSEGFRAAECALIVVSGKSGVTVGAEKAFKAASDRGMAKLFFVNKLDSEHADFYKVFTSLRAAFGSCICPVVVPFMDGHKVQCYVNLISRKAYTYSNGKVSECAMPELGETLDALVHEIREAVAETSEELLDKFIMEEEFTDEEISTALASGVRSGAICPVFCGVTNNADGVSLMLDNINWLVPSPVDAKPEIGVDADGNEVEIIVDENAPTAAVVFKTVADPFVGKLSYFKVFAGKISSDTPLVNMRTGATEKINKALIIRGKKQEDAACIVAGDIGAVAKLQSALTGDTFCAASRQITLKGVEFPLPCLSMAILPKTKGEEDKVAQGLGRLAEEDPSFSFVNNAETHQLVLSGQGDQHIDVIVSKLKSKFGVEVTLETPRVAYRETIRKTVEQQGRHKKQSGGHGQFGDVYIRFEPCECDGLEFVDEVVGGAVPRQYIPSVEKGLLNCIKHGVLAGYPVVGLRAALYFGSSHAVDSSDMAFQMAASIAYKEGLPKAKPTLLEPVGLLKAYVPNDNMGDVMGDITKRRGRVLGMNPAADGLQELQAEVPMAEMHDFATFMRQCAQGRGYFTLEFIRYEDAPDMVAQKVIEDAKARGEIE